MHCISKSAAVAPDLGHLELYRHHEGWTHQIGRISSHRLCRLRQARHPALLLVWALLMRCAPPLVDLGGVDAAFSAVTVLTMIRKRLCNTGQHYRSVLIEWRQGGAIREAGAASVLFATLG
jgi:hypothetical protein